MCPDAMDSPRREPLREPPTAARSNDTRAFPEPSYPSEASGASHPTSPTLPPFPPQAGGPSRPFPAAQDRGDWLEQQYVRALATWPPAARSSKPSEPLSSGPLQPFGPTGRPSGRPSATTRPIAHPTAYGTAYGGYAPASRPLTPIPRPVLRPPASGYDAYAESFAVALPIPQRGGSVHRLTLPPQVAALAAPTTRRLAPARREPSGRPGLRGLWVGVLLWVLVLSTALAWVVGTLAVRP